MSQIAQLPTGVALVVDGALAVPHVTGMVPETELDLSVEPLVGDPLLNYTYHNINHMIRKNSFDGMSEATTPVSGHWTPPPFSTPPAAALGAPGGTTPAAVAPAAPAPKRVAPDGDIFHCQPQKRKSFSLVGGPSAGDASVLSTIPPPLATQIVYPALSARRMATVLAEAKVQRLNIPATTAVLTLLGLTNLRRKLLVLAHVFSTCAQSGNCTDNDTLAYSGNFADGSPHDYSLIVGELANLGALSIVVPQGRNLVPQEDSVLFPLQHSPLLASYFAPIPPSAFASPLLLYKETMQRVFALLAFANSIAAYTKHRALQDNRQLATLAQETHVLDAMARANARESAAIKLNLVFRDLDPHLLSRVAAIMWLSEDPAVKRAFCV